MKAFVTFQETKPSTPVFSSEQTIEPFRDRNPTDLAAHGPLISNNHEIVWSQIRHALTCPNLRCPVWPLSCLDQSFPLPYTISQKLFECCYTAYLYFFYASKYSYKVSTHTPKQLLLTDHFLHLNSQKIKAQNK